MQWKTDSPVAPSVSRRMSNTRGRDTQPELAVRRRLHAMGMRYRVNVRPVPELRRTADIVFGPARVAVLIDGCFWHGCPKHYRPASGSRAEFWASKIAANQHRDRASTSAFEDAGWLVLRFWEHENPAQVAESVGAAVRSRRR